MTALHQPQVSAIGTSGEKHPDPSGTGMIEVAAPVGSLAAAHGSDSGLADCSKAQEIAVFACEEQQPMPSEGVSNRLIAEACERIGETHAGFMRWRDCAHAHRMACWYFRKALDE